jgi:hypothetical protein
MLRSTALALTAILIATATASAGETGRFLDAVEAAYAHYRAAMFYLRTENPAVASIELGDAGAIWDAKVSPFAAAAPDAFVDDRDFAMTLQSVARRLREGEAAAIAENIAGARDALAPIRTELAALRARSGVVRFSDLVDEANAAMDRLFRFRHAPPDWSDPAAVDALRADAAVTTYLYRRCRDEAGPEVQASAEFHRIVDNAIASLEQLPAAIRAHDEAAVIRILRELRSFDRMLWLRFG